MIGDVPTRETSLNNNSYSLRSTIVLNFHQSYFGVIKLPFNYLYSEKLDSAKKNSFLIKVILSINMFLKKKNRISYNEGRPISFKLILNPTDV